jgi:hypothetical protein
VERWIREHGTDPVDRDLSLDVRDLSPNLAVRSMVESFVSSNWTGPLPEVAREDSSDDHEELFPREEHVDDQSDASSEELFPAQAITSIWFRPSSRSGRAGQGGAATRHYSRVV